MGVSSPVIDFFGVPAGSKPLCAIADNTTADSAGTQPTPEDAAADSADQRHAVGWIKT